MSNTFDSIGNQDISIELEINVIIAALVESPAFVNAVRNIILADVRRMGNAFGKYAQASAPTAATSKRRIS